ncbi:MAG: universal stress protein [Ideonella sp.]|nr:universal stress protein [Ideonella sp.]MBL0150768.1 universal stress protein [Ideonella sp.]
MSYRHLLVPIDGTPLAANVVSGAVALARDMGARICFLHVVADFGASGDGALLHAADPKAFADGALGNARVLLAKAEASARVAGVDATTICVEHDRPHEAILDTARAQGCDLVYMASHGRRGIRAVWQTSVVQRLLQQTVLPVLVSEVESNHQASDAQRALATIREEHRSLAAVIHALQRVMQSATQSAAPPDFGLLRAMLYYIEHFPERLHHPKEEAYLFSRLAQHTRDFDAVIEKLRGQHREGGELFGQLRAALQGYEAGTVNSSSFAASIEAFASAQWEHMRAEEKVIMPAALIHLSSQDWTEVAAAFLDNHDPRFGEEADEPFSELCVRVLNLAADSSAAARIRP